MRYARVTLPAIALACATACGSRASYWDLPVAPQGATYGLANGVAIVDDAAHRVVIVEAQPGQSVTEQAVPIGHNVVTAQASPDGSSLLVLASGDWPQQTAADEPPSLTVIDVDPNTLAAKPTTYPMTQPMPSLAVDPLGDYAVAYTGAGTSTSFVQNPNEIVLFDLHRGPSPATSTSPNPDSRTIQSFGGTPQQLTFTPQLTLPGGATRLLLLESNIDLTLLDLGHAFDLPGSPHRPEITVQLTDGTTSQQITPAGVVVDGGDGDARIALWSSDDPDVYVYDFIPSSQGAANPFVPSPNVAPVGGIPSQVAFVHTSDSAADDDGLRVLALVPSSSSAVLIDSTGKTTSVTLPASYTNMSLVTGVVAAGGSTDVALLWDQSGAAPGDVFPSTSTSGVAFWNLGQTVGGIDVVNVPGAIQSVLDVPGDDPTTRQLKILQLAGNEGIAVLDLSARTASPLDTTTSPTIALSLDGTRMWAYSQGGTDLAEIALPSLDITPLTTDAPIGAAYDVVRSDKLPSLVALHPQGTWSATVFDGTTPSTATARDTTALLLEASP